VSPGSAAVRHRACAGYRILWLVLRLTSAFIFHRILRRCLRLFASLRRLRVIQPCHRFDFRFLRAERPTFGAEVRPPLLLRSVLTPTAPDSPAGFPRLRRFVQAEVLSCITSMENPNHVGRESNAFDPQKKKAKEEREQEPRVLSKRNGYPRNSRFISSPISYLLCQRSVKNDLGNSHPRKRS